MCLQVRTFNVDKTKNMRMLNPEDIDQLITISGMVIRTSPLIPEMREVDPKTAVCIFDSRELVAHFQPKRNKFTSACKLPESKVEED